MAFTYDLTQASGKLRLRIGDNIVSPSGVLPNGANFQDDEITYALTRAAGAADVEATAAVYLLDAAIARWTVQPASLSADGASVAYRAVDELGKLRGRIALEAGIGGVGGVTVVSAAAESLLTDEFRR